MALRTVPLRVPEFGRDASIEGHLSPLTVHGDSGEDRQIPVLEGLGLLDVKKDSESVVLHVAEFEVKGGVNRSKTRYANN
jgi:hypothetical protein